MFARNLARRFISSSAAASIRTAVKSSTTTTTTAATTTTGIATRSIIGGALTLGFFLTTARAAETESEQQQQQAEQTATPTTTAATATETEQPTEQTTTSDAASTSVSVEELKNIDLSELILNAHNNVTNYTNAKLGNRSAGMIRSPAKRVEDNLAALKKALPPQVYSRISRKKISASDIKSPFLPQANKDAKFVADDAIARLGDEADGACGELFQQTFKHYEQVSELLQSFVGMRESEIALKFSEEYTIIRDATNVSLDLEKCMVENGIPQERFVEAITSQ